MKRAAGGKSGDAFWIVQLAIVILGFCLVSCSSPSRPVQEADYATKIVGSWQGMVGNIKETMSIHGDGTFVCQLQPTGFISIMLFPKAPGTIRGTWNINGALITLNITGEKHERVENSTASSTIVTFNDDELVLKSNRGDTSPFRRVRSF